MSDKLRALVIGCGRIAGGLNSTVNDAMVLTHALAYLRHPHFELAACVEPDERRRREFMEKWGVAKGFRTLDEALARHRFDIASVCTSTGTHISVLAQLAESNVQAVFAEKPLDGNVAGAREVAARFAGKQVPVAVNFTRRFDPSIQALRSEFAAGQHGDLRRICGWYSRGVLNNGSHMIDLVTFLTGRTPELRAVAGIACEDILGDPTVSASLDLGDAQFDLIGCDGRDFVRFELEFVFSQGIVALENGGLSIRRRPIEDSAFKGTRSASYGTWEHTRYGDAMVYALNELNDWSAKRSLSSDIDSAIAAIAVSNDIRALALELRAA